MNKRPNILLFMSDQHHRDYMGCAGHPFLRTPNLDRLAFSGIRFTNAYCANPICGPSRMAFLTSRSSSDIQFWNNGAQLASDTATFVHHLATVGYQTVLCGRMHFDGPETRYGYQQRLVGEQRWIAPSIPFTKVMPHTADALKFSGWGRTPWHQYDEDVTAAAACFLTDPQRQRDDQPWFLTIGTSLPHDPCICPQDLFQEYHAQCHVPALPDDYLDSVHPATRLWRQRAGVDEVSESILRSARAGYCGLITFEDQLVGRVLEALELGGHTDDTIVIYTSDHGDMAGHLRMWWKTTFYDGSCGVPLIVSWPGRFRGHKVENAVCSLLDIGPTLVEAADGEPMTQVRGRSLLRFLTPGPSAHFPAWPNTAFAEKVYRPGIREPARMIRRDRWKLNHYHGYKDPELFDLEADPGEWHDLGRDPRHADVRAALTEAVLDGWSGEAVVRHFERWDADRIVRDRFREITQTDTKDTRWSPAQESWFHRGYDA